MQNKINIKIPKYKTGVIEISIQRIIFCFLGFIATIMTIDSGAILGYEYQFLLPLIYTTVYLLFAPPMKELGMGYLVLNGVWVARYLLTPVLIRLSGYSIAFNIGVSDKSLYQALFLMILELCVIIISCRIFYERSKKIEKKSINRKYDIKNMGFIIILLLMLLSIFVMIIDRKSLYAFNFILDSQFARSSGTNWGISAIILSWCKMIFTLWFVTILGKMNSNRESITNLVLAIVIVFLSMSFFIGTARVEILLETLAYIYMLIIFFPKHKKKVVVVCFSGMFFLLLSITLYRYFNTRIFSDALNVFDLEGMARMFNGYFAGQKNVSVGVTSIQLYGHKYSIPTLFRDLFGNTIILNKLVSRIPGTVQIFNETLYGHTLWADQISPTITQSLALFNIFGVLVLPIISYVIVKMDRISKSSNYALEIFLAVLISTRIAFFSPGNITILSTAINNQFIPLCIIFKISKIKTVREKL